MICNQSSIFSGNCALGLMVNENNRKQHDPPSVPLRGSSREAGEGVYYRYKAVCEKIITN